MKFNIDQKSAGVRLDKFLTEEVADATRSQIQKMMKQGVILVNGEPGKSNYKLVKGDRIEIGTLAENFQKFTAEDLNLKFVYEDKDFFVVDKPAGLVVHPDRSGKAQRTLVQAVLEKIEPGVGEETRPGIVHRLDKDTSGLLVVAKNQFAYEYFVELFKKRKVGKYYLALVVGALEHKHGIIDAPVGRSVANRKKMGLLSDGKGKKAISVYKVVKEYKLDSNSTVSLLEVEIKTGRTHQIRVHMNGIGHPVVGDITYGIHSFNKKMTQKFELGRQFLHAQKLIFEHPRTGKKMELISELPEDLKRVITSLQQ